MWQTNLIKLYCAVCDNSSTIEAIMQRQSNNFRLLDWFPKLPSYQAFSERLNKLVPAFQALAEVWLDAIDVDVSEQMECIVDFCPIILAKGPRSGHTKVASELCEKAIIRPEKNGITA